ncbi:MAG: hypothetical protein AB7O24_14170 [Kofleriaceae bacterium]
MTGRATSRGGVMLAAIAAVVATAGCEVDPPDRWHYIYETVVTPSCTTSACHSQLAHSAMLDLSDDATAFEALTGRACGDDAMASGLVNVASPRDSLLSIMLRRTGPTGMPPNARLPDGEIELIEQWMQRGAPCD